MATDLTGNKIKDTYQQILHVDGGVTSTDKTVYDGDGTATALKVSTTSVDVTALKLAGSAITVTAAQINAGVDAQPAAEAAALAAASSASAAASSASSAATAYDQFDDRYLGSKSSAPTVDNDGNALLVGALYFNSVTTNMNVWNGSAWTATYIPVTGYAPLANPAFTGEVTENGYDIVSQADIGTAPNEIPLNQYLGSLAYQDLDSVTINGGNATLDVATITAIQNDTAISNVQPSLNLDFANVKKLDSRITYARASEARYYDGKTVSKAEENLVPYSQEFDNGYWVKSSATVTANTTTAPDGTTTAETLLAATNSATHYFYKASTLTALPYTFSIYAKDNGQQYLQIAVYQGAFLFCNFDVQNGIAGTPSSGTANIQDVGNGWYRCSLTVTGASIGGFVYVISSDSLTAGFQPTFAGDGTSGLFIWGAQLEQRSAVSSYTPTTTQPITNYQPTLLTASANVARFDHDPITNESLGLLIEEQRTNLLTYSEDFGNAGWTKGEVTVNANQVVAPDGTLTGDKLVENTNNTIHFVQRSAVSGTTLGSTYAWSFYVKQAGRNFIHAGEASTPNGIYFDIENGIVGTASSGYSGQIESLGNDWFRCKIIFTSTATSRGIFITTAIADGNRTYTGDGYSGIYIWGAQLEAGAFPTSYIPTVASQVTRSADSASMTGANFSSWYRNAGGSVYSETAVFGTATGVGVTYPWSIRNDSPVTFPASLYLVSTTGYQPVAYANAGFIYNPTFTVIANAYAKTGMTFANNNYISTVNGGTVNTSTTIILPTVLPNYLSFSTFVSKMYIKKFAYYPTAFNSAELIEMTS